MLILCLGLLRLVGLTWMETPDVFLPNRWECLRLTLNLNLVASLMGQLEMMTTTQGKSFIIQARSIKND